MNKLCLLPVAGLLLLFGTERMYAQQQSNSNLGTISKLLSMGYELRTANLSPLNKQSVSTGASSGQLSVYAEVADGTAYLSRPGEMVVCYFRVIVDNGGEKNVVPTSACYEVR